MRFRKGLLITFEGTEGAGKSTLIRTVDDELERRWNLRAILTREPGGSPIAERIRNVILEEAVDPLAELFLYEAARAEHMARKIHPALKEGRIVLCDRFTDSALAYQAHARGLSWKTVHLLNGIATQERKPDLTVLLDIDPAEGLKRAREHNRFEAEGVAFQRRVRSGFLKAKAEDPRRWLILPVKGRTPATLASAVCDEIDRRFIRPTKKKPRKAPRK